MIQSDAFKRYAKRMSTMLLDPEFAFATGRVKVLEERLLTLAKLEELAKPEFGLDQLDAALTDAGYPAAESIGKRIAAGAAENDALLKELTQDGPLAQGLLLQSDMHNLKVILKYLKEVNSKAYKQGHPLDPEKTDEKTAALPAVVADLVFKEAMIPPLVLWEGLRRDLAGGPAAYGQSQTLLDVAKEDMRHWATDYRPAAMDMRIDQAWFKQLGLLAEAQGKGNAGKYLMLYREMLADLLNLQSGARLLRMHGAINTYQDSFVEGGSVSWEDAYKALMNGALGFKIAFRQSAAAPLLPYLDDFIKGKNIYAFGRVMAEIRLEFARFGLAAGNGIPQVAGYWLARRLEAQNLRIILAGKSNRSQEKRSLSLLRDTYRRGRG